MERCMQARGQKTSTKRGYGPHKLTFESHHHIVESWLSLGLRAHHWQQLRTERGQRPTWSSTAIQPCRSYPYATRLLVVCKQQNTASAPAALNDTFLRFQDESGDHRRVSEHNARLEKYWRWSRLANSKPFSKYTMNSQHRPYSEGRRLVKTSDCSITIFNNG